MSKKKIDKSMVLKYVFLSIAAFISIFPFFLDDYKCY